MKAVVFALFIIYCTSAAAQVNKCKGPNGKIIYSDTACAGPGEVEQVRINQNTLESSGERRLGEAASSKANPELDDLKRRSRWLQEQSDLILSKGSRITIGDSIRLKELRAEQKLVQRSMMISAGQDTTSFDNDDRFEKLDRKVRRMELDQNRIRNEHNNPIINGRQCTRNGSYVNC